MPTEDTKNTQIFFYFIFEPFPKLILYSYFSLKDIGGATLGYFRMCRDFLSIIIFNHVETGKLNNCSPTYWNEKSP